MIFEQQLKNESSCDDIKHDDYGVAIEFFSKTSFYAIENNTNHKGPKDHRPFHLYLQKELQNDITVQTLTRRLKHSFNNAFPEIASRTDAVRGLEGSIRREFHGEMYNDGMEDKIKRQYLLEL